MPKVSIIIPTYNCAAYVEDCILSVTNQTERDIEIIVVDDGSTDQTLEILKKLESSDDRIFVHSGPNNGFAGFTRNRGISHARGKFIAFLDGDDLYAPEKIQRVVSVFEAFPLTDVVFHDLVRFEQRPDEPGAVGFLKHSGFLDLAQSYLSETADSVHLCHKNFYNFVSLRFIPFHISAITIRREALLSGSYWFREDLRPGEDGDLWLRLANNLPFAFLNQPLSYYRQRSGSIMSDQLRYLLATVQIHRENLERGREQFNEQELRIYRSKIAEFLFTLGYVYFCRNSIKDARLAYKQSLDSRFRISTLLGYLKTFVPRPVVTKYRQLSRK